ncbi:hypothetical protein ZWY2020_036094 [Hordeum vulgare]|nr:hypothetical protein ZWY2020_036094 [Hordeum vulgare]
MMLRMNEAAGSEGSDNGSSEVGSYEYEEELEHHLRVHHQEHLGGVDGDGDDDLKAEEHVEDHINAAQDSWQEVDLDEYSYEELVALGKVVGTQSRGLSADTLAFLPFSNLQHKRYARRQHRTEGESLVALTFKHSYHPDRINRWLQLNKVCAMCSTEFLPQQTSRHDQQASTLVYVFVSCQRRILFERVWCVGGNKIIEVKR